ncbi:MAG: hypothetical protein K7J46_17555 [Bryobacter sp.]|nr:hypothetical protein [Bryobacter sp. CoA8 C33]
MVDALTRFDFEISNHPPTLIHGQFTLPPNTKITIATNSGVWSGVSKTPALLSHEMFHYGAGIVTTRALARHLANLPAPNVPAFRAALQDARDLHFLTRARLLQLLYDLDTHHGKSTYFQNLWKQRKAACLTNPLADYVGGFLLKPQSRKFQNLYLPSPQSLPPHPRHSPLRPMPRSPPWEPSPHPKPISLEQHHGSRPTHHPA